MTLYHATCTPVLCGLSVDSHTPTVQVLNIPGFQLFSAFLLLSPTAEHLPHPILSLQAKESSGEHRWDSFIFTFFYSVSNCWCYFLPYNEDRNRTANWFTRPKNVSIKHYPAVSTQSSSISALQTAQTCLPLHSILLVPVLQSKATPKGNWLPAVVVTTWQAVSLSKEKLCLDFRENERTQTLV